MLKEHFGLFVVLAKRLKEHFGLFVVLANDHSVEALRC